jgi:hypothetical protein
VACGATAGGRVATGVGAAERAERVRAEPFDAIELQVGVLFGDDEDAV